MNLSARSGRRRPQIQRYKAPQGPYPTNVDMDSAELARLQEHYRRLPDAKLAELHAEGPAAFATREVWAILENELKGRAVPRDQMENPPSETPTTVVGKILGINTRLERSTAPGLTP